MSTPTRTAELLRTEGYGLQALVRVGGLELVVMDAFSAIGSPSRPGTLHEVRLSALEIEGLAWEETFAGNSERETRLERVCGWSYYGYGRIVSIRPTRVDLGVDVFELGPSTNDQRCCGEYVKVRIDRLDLIGPSGP